MLRFCFFIIVLSAGTTSATAQNLRVDRIDLGLRGGYEFDGIDRASVGSELRVYFRDRPYLVSPAFDVYLMDDDRSLVQFDLNGLYPFDPGFGLFPYMGLGLGYTRITSQGRSLSETGVNLVFGFFVEVTYVQLFIQGRSTLSHFDTVSAQAGLSFPFFRR